MHKPMLRTCELGIGPGPLHIRELYSLAESIRKDTESKWVRPQGGASDSAYIKKGDITLKVVAIHALKHDGGVIGDYFERLEISVYPPCSPAHQRYANEVIAAIERTGKGSEAVPMCRGISIPGAA